MTNRDSQILDDMFAQSREQVVPISDELTARVLNDAARLQSAPSVAVPTWRALIEMIGGWPTMGGLVAAGVAGLWIGIAPPTGLTTIASELSGSNVTVDLWGDDLFGTQEWIDG